MGWVVNATPQSLNPRKTGPVVILQVGGLVWIGAENLAPPTGIDPRNAQPLASEVRQRCTKEEVGRVQVM
jgi:hypothetical protein